MVGGVGGRCGGRRGGLRCDPPRLLQAEPPSGEAGAVGPLRLDQGLSHLGHAPLLLPADAHGAVRRESGRYRYAPACAPLFPHVFLISPPFFLPLRSSLTGYGAIWLAIKTFGNSRKPMALFRITNKKMYATQKPLNMLSVGSWSRHLWNPL